MNHYEQACKWHESAVALMDSGFYQQSIYHFYLVGELYLKSALPLVEHDDRLELSHDIIGLYSALSKRYGETVEMKEATSFLRKYYNESRYPSMEMEFTKAGYARNPRESGVRSQKSECPWRKHLTIC